MNQPGAQADPWDDTEALRARVAAAAAAGQPLSPRGSGSKAFYGNPGRGEALDLTGHRGVIRYQPTELMVTVRSGTPLGELEATLAAEGQMLPFEPPRFAGGGTVGGAVASGLAGPGRPFRGAVRDALLGVRVINGRGEVLRFGGEVVKNVAGYDLSRPMAGALGTLGVLLDVSLKVIPQPVAEATRTLEIAPESIWQRVHAAQAAGCPITGAVHDGERLHLRLSGAEEGVRAATRHLGGDTPEDGDAFWSALRDHTLAFFADTGVPLWRLALPPAQPLPELPGGHLLDWAGQQLWLRSDAPAARVRAAAEAVGGHATRWRGADTATPAFHPPSAGVARLNRQLKQALDPHHILNPGRFAPEL
ncbi:glycolate oxidase subunit GlcE [Halorhodospira halophila]|uniref:FAD linked oxidase domain protein n=1 Tax=Halorhodospira halophila (strain DSM 244 / SL1) TaxID=349124 RepID=A1WTK4_HALHL|nr:glycolate oxidase subunit GlcE [Halorhodospira halophila]ABM61016.1 FAD linked oxidase domain protein [Halorhodospira halophila SL1]MBK1729975.1 glycolate oxidase subunit GlcE [Halorhodospira halophila]